MKKEQAVKKMIALHDRELNEVTGGLTTFPDKDGVDRHSWFVTLLMNLLLKLFAPRNCILQRGVRLLRRCAHAGCVHRGEEVEVALLALESPSPEPRKAVGHLGIALGVVLLEVLHPLVRIAAWLATAVIRSGNCDFVCSRRLGLRGSEPALQIGDLRTQCLDASRLPRVRKRALRRILPFRLRLFRRRRCGRPEAEAERDARQQRSRRQKRRPPPLPALHVDGLLAR